MEQGGGREGASTPVPVLVTDPLDPRLADFRDLTDSALRRRLEPELGLFVAEGAPVVERALAAGYPLRALLLAEARAGVLDGLLLPAGATVLLAPDDVLGGVAGYPVHRGVLASFERRGLPTAQDLLASAELVAVLEAAVDPTNVGAVARSAAGLGADALLLDPWCADPLYRRAVRVSMGATLTLPHARLEPWPRALGDLREAGLTLLALTPGPDALDLAELPRQAVRRCALLLGTEGRGLSRQALAEADLRVRIPMASGVDSLNVAAAAAVAFWAVRQARLRSGEKGAGRWR